MSDLKMIWFFFGVSRAPTQPAVRGLVGFTRTAFCEPWNCEYCSCRIGCDFVRSNNMIAYESIWNKHISGSPRTGWIYCSYLGRIQNPKSIRVSRGVEDKRWLATIGAKPIHPPENKGRSPERSWDWKTIRLLFEVFSLLLGKNCSFVGC